MFKKFIIPFFVLSVFGINFKLCCADQETTSKFCDFALRENSLAAKWWLDSKSNLYMPVHIFNYTNLEDFFAGRADKIKLEDVGPYFYTLNVTKYNVSFNSDSNTISYKEKRIAYFVPHLNNLDLDALITLPNIPFLYTVKKILQSNAANKKTLAEIIKESGAKMFTVQKVKDAIWGYQDDLINKLVSSNHINPIFRFGVVGNLNGSFSTSFEIHTGVDDPNKLAKLIEMNGIRKLKTWDQEECNEIVGTDGALYPSKIIDKNQTLNIFFKGLCRPTPLEFLEEVDSVDGIKALRYTFASDMFDESSARVKSHCYCTNATCPPVGIFDTSKCFFGSPEYVSFPHFYSGDEKLFAKFEGLNPNATEHRTYFDYHPTLGIRLNGAMRFQANVKVHKIDDIHSDLDHFDDGDILPVIWFEGIFSEISKEDLNIAARACDENDV